MKQIWAKATFYKKKFATYFQNYFTENSQKKMLVLTQPYARLREQATFHETDTDVHNIIDLPHSINM